MIGWHGRIQRFAEDTAKTIMRQWLVGTLSVNDLLDMGTKDIIWIRIIHHSLTRANQSHHTPQPTNHWLHSY